MLVFFPVMHAELLPCALPAGVRLLDPGYRDAPFENALRPGNLPLAPAEARALVRDSVGFGEQFQAPGDLAAYGLREALSRDKEASSAIQAEFSRRMAGRPEAQVQDPAPAQAQMALLLAWFFEERHLEMQGLEQGLAASWQVFGRSLGLEEGGDDSELDQALDGLAAPLLGRPQYPWPVLLESAALLLPPEAGLVIADAEMALAWKEAGLDLTPAEQVEAFRNLPPATLSLRAPIWRLSGRKRLPAERPGLARLLDVAVLPD